MLSILAAFAICVTCDATSTYCQRPTGACCEPLSALRKSQRCSRKGPSAKWPTRGRLCDSSVWDWPRRRQGPWESAAAVDKGASELVRLGGLLHGGGGRGGRHRGGHQVEVAGAHLPLVPAGGRNTIPQGLHQQAQLMQVRVRTRPSGPGSRAPRSAVQAHAHCPQVPPRLVYSSDTSSFGCCTHADAEAAMHQLSHVKAHRVAV